MTILSEMRDAGVPAMACSLTPTERVALGLPYKSSTCQWVIDEGVAECVGDDGDEGPITGPDAAMIQLVVDTFAAYVAPAPVVIPSNSLIQRAMAKAARDKTLTQEEEDALDYVEAQ